MSKIKVGLAMVTFLFFFTSFTSNLLLAQTPIGKIVDSHMLDSTTFMLLEVNRYLDTGQSVYLYGGIPVVVREAMSISEKEGINYYRAYTPEKVRALPGESVFLDPVAKKSKLPDFERKALFMKKKYATVTLVEDGKALINRGSLHNVDKRDVYGVIDKNGKRKGKIELYGIGDFISAGQIEHSAEEGWPRERMEVGDSIEYLGNRKILGIGFVSSRAFSQTSTKPGGGRIYLGGGGLVWSVHFRNGMSAEWLWGQYSKVAYAFPPVGFTSILLYPIGLKKNFYHPSDISPYGVVGLSYFRVKVAQGGIIFDEKRGFLPYFGIGVEFFSGRLFHLRLEAQYSRMPKITYQDTVYETDGFNSIFGASVNW
ncbi:MAG: hypothetical protein HY547_03060 [Elusimicrobia bacterium]|nr:hypothetical protein [Elusimicrobiota bacterium]